jgi:hypothetical protein
MNKIYVASSWRNYLQAGIVHALRSLGHEVYDFRNPKPGNTGFHWRDIHPDYMNWTPTQFKAGIGSPVAVEGFQADYAAMQWADTGVLVLPSGRSSHLEAGYFSGAGKPWYIVMFGSVEPELMYRMATGIFTNMDDFLTEFEIRKN